MTEIELKKRYPHSRTEDITDAFMRGYEYGYKSAYKLCLLAEVRERAEQTEPNGKVSEISTGSEKPNNFDKDINVRSKEGE